MDPIATEGLNSLMMLASEGGGVFGTAGLVWLLARGGYLGGSSKQTGELERCTARLEGALDRLQRIDQRVESLHKALPTQEQLVATAVERAQLTATLERVATALEGLRA